MLVAGVMLALLGAFALPASVRERVLYTFEQRTQAARVEVGGVRLDTSTSARLTSWQEALEAAGDSPLWGLGVTGYGFLDAQYPRILVETGGIGLMAFLLLIGAVLRACLGVFRRAREPLDRGLAMGAVAGLVGLLVHAIGANTFIIVRIMEPFWFVVGLVVTLDRLQPEAGSPTGSSEAA
jgi:O-antigen ligase